MKMSILIGILGLASMAGAAKKNDSGRFYFPGWSSAPACSGRPEFLTETRSDFLKSLADLPSVVLVARDAEYYIEGEKEKRPMRLYGYQSFLNKQASGRVICGDMPGDLKERLSLVAPTLIDNQKVATIGQTLWQFQLISDGSRFAFWNLKKPMQEARGNIEKRIQENGASYKIYQRSHNEYELLITKTVGSLTQHLSIRYDAIKKY